MPQFDLPLAELPAYRPTVEEPADFDAFWQRSLAEAAEHPLAARFESVADPLYQHVRVQDVTFAGYAGEPVRGWLVLPPGPRGPLACLVRYVGYGGGRSLPLDHLAPAVAGLAHLVMDTRGQGSGWSPGDTPDSAGSGPAYPGFMTRGIERAADYYYRRVFVDAARALDAAAAHPEIDAARIGVCGASQGGGIALAVAALAAERVKLLLADVPFLCYFERAIRITDALPYAEITRYLRCHRDRAAAVLRTLAYFDGVHFAPRIRCRALFSAALMDQVCPPSTVFAAYNRVASSKDIRVFDYNEHEGGGVFQALEGLRLARQML